MHMIKHHDQHDWQYQLLALDVNGQLCNLGLWCLYHTNLSGLQVTLELCSSRLLRNQELGKH